MEQLIHQLVEELEVLIQEQVQQVVQVVEVGFKVYLLQILIQDQGVLEILLQLVLHKVMQVEIV